MVRCFRRIHRSSDYLIRKALERKYGGEVILTPLDDSQEKEANDYILSPLCKGIRTVRQKSSVFQRKADDFCFLRYCVDKKKKETVKMRVERFKMEREGLVTEGQEVEISERSAVTGQYTYLVEPSIAMSGIYRTRQRIRARKGKIKKIEQTDRGFYLLVEIDE